MTVDEVIANLLKSGNHVTPDGRVLPSTAATLVGCTTGHLANLRSRGQGPTWYRLGRVWYRVDELLSWIDQHAHRNADS